MPEAGQQRTASHAIKCPHCGRVFKVGPEVSGKQVTCGRCRRNFTAPRLPGAGSAPPPVGGAGRVWSLHVDGKTTGPHDFGSIVERIKSREIDGSALVWKDGMADWEELATRAEFKSALAAAGAGGSSAARRAAVGHGPRPGRGHQNDEEPRRRRHYARGRGKRDAIVGAWVAGILAIGVLVGVLIIVNQPEEPEDPLGSLIAPLPPGPGARASTAGRPGTAGRTPRAPAKLPRKTRLGRVVKDLERRFTEVIDAHKKGDPRPIGSFIRYCRLHAKSLAEYQWGEYKVPMGKFMARLNEAADGVETILKEKPWRGGGLGEGVDPKIRAEALRLNEYEWLQNWADILRREIEALRKAGLRF